MALQLPNSDVFQLETYARNGLVYCAISNICSQTKYICPKICTPIHVVWYTVYIYIIYLFIFYLFIYLFIFIFIYLYIFIRNQNTEMHTYIYIYIYVYIVHVISSALAARTVAGQSHWFARSLEGPDELDRRRFAMDALQLSQPPALDCHWAGPAVARHFPWAFGTGTPYHFQKHYHFGWFWRMAFK